MADTLTACDWHTCRMCGMEWDPADGLDELPASEIPGCSEWHRYHCGEVIDVDPDTAPDFRYVVGRPDRYGGACYVGLAEAKDRARSASTRLGGMRVAVKDEEDRVLHLYDDGREVAEGGA